MKLLSKIIGDKNKNQLSKTIANPNFHVSKSFQWLLLLFTIFVTASFLNILIRASLADDPASLFRASIVTSIAPILFLVILPVALLELLKIISFSKIKRAKVSLAFIKWSLLISIINYNLFFVWLYCLISSYNANAFSEHLSVFDSLFLTINTFTTMGFSEITPVSAGAKWAFMGQTITGFVILVFIIGYIVSSYSVAAKRLNGKNKLHQED